MPRSKLPIITDKEWDAAVERGKLEMANGASGVTFDLERDSLIITMKNGCVAIIPRTTIPEFRSVDPKDLVDVEVTPLCSGLLFNTIDEGTSLFGLIREAFGINTQNRIAGMTLSDARAAASRSNGKKGGRPKKTTAAQRQESRSPNATRRA